MPRISQESIFRVRREAPILEVVGAHVQLKRSGREWRGLSPFNQEKTPSFFVNPDKNAFYCYSSGQGGSVIRFVEMVERLNFPEAVETLAKRFGIPLEYESGGPTREERSLRAEMLAIHEYAVDYYHREFLAHSEAGRAIREYWQTERRFSMDVAEDFRIGYSPPDKAGLLEALASQKFSLEAYRQCGLFFGGARARQPSDLGIRFRGRLMIPIRALQGEVVAFTARRIALTPDDHESQQAKYINSPDSPLFTKSRILFNLDRARTAISDDSPPLLVEGQLDAIRCASSGFPTAVAPQGTSVTEEQLGLVRRYGTRIDCLLDGDQAGRKAALRLLPMAFKAGIEVRFTALPDGTDPDDLLAGGEDAPLRALLDQSDGPIAFALDSLGVNRQSGPREKADALRELGEMVTEADSSILQQGYVEEAAGILAVDRSAAWRDFRRFTARRRRNSQRHAGETASETPSVRNGKTANGLTTVEGELLHCLLHHPELAVAIAQTINPDWLESHHPHGRLLSRILADISEGLWEGVESAEEWLANDEELQNAFYALVTRAPSYTDAVAVANGCLQSLFHRFVRQRRQLLQDRQREILEHSRAAGVRLLDHPDIRALRDELNHLNIRRSQAPTLSISSAD